LYLSEYLIVADTLLCYVSTPYEVSTALILRTALSNYENRANGTNGALKTVAVPRINGSVMDFFVINSENDLEPGHFGIYEPKRHCKPLYSYHNAVCITPGLIFTEDGNRLGYGKGYYDRFFKEHPEILKIGLAFEKNIYRSDFMETDKFDIPVDIIFTERRIIDVRQ
jgi:5-formyltetrahydrofolate cyclo-ligase